MSNVTPPVPKEELPDYELRVQRHGWRKLTHWLRSTLAGRLSVAALVAAILLAWQGPALHRAAKVWRVKQLLAHSEDARQAGDATAETRLLQEAFTLLPGHALNLRAQAHSFERRGEAPALLAYHRLLGHAQATVDDAIRACRLAVLRGSPDTCEQILALAERIKDAGEPAALLALRARVKAADRSWHEALALAEQAVEAADSAAPEKLLLATTLLQATDRATAAERLPMAERGVALLSELALSPNETAVEALNALVSLARQPAAVKLFAGREVQAWTAAAERHPQASARLRIQAWNLPLVGQREKLEQFFAGFLEKWREAPLPERLEAARWLNQHGRPRLCLALSFQEKETSEDWFLLHLDALAAARQWTALLEHLDAETGQAAKLSGALRTLFRLIARAELREPIDVETAWREIQIQLQSDPVPTQLFIAQYAEKIGEFRQAAIAYRRILDLSSTAARAHNLSREAKFACYTGLLRSLPVSAPLAEVRLIAEALSAEFPELEEARNEAIYLRVLAGQMDEQVRADLAGLLQHSPEAPAFRATAALIALHSGDAAAANKLCEDLRIDWNSASDRFKLIRSAVLAASGRAEEARAMRTKIRESNLRPEEVALLP